MNGIEKITQRIESDAQTEIDALLAAAHKSADATAAAAKKQAEELTASLHARNEKAASEREERLISVAQMESRKVLLGAKQSMVERAFDLALDKLCAMPDGAYTQAAAKLLVQAAPDGGGEVIFSAKDRARIGAAAVEQANALLSGGKLKLSDETRDIRGGFLLVNGSVEVNATFETLVRLQKGAMAGETAKLLFPEG